MLVALQSIEFCKKKERKYSEKKEFVKETKKTREYSFYIQISHFNIFFLVLKKTFNLFWNNLHLY
jgi:hypothetical protein